MNASQSTLFPPTPVAEPAPGTVTYQQPTPPRIRGRCFVCLKQRIDGTEVWVSVEEWNDTTKAYAPRVSVCSRACVVAFASG